MRCDFSERLRITSSMDQGRVCIPVEIYRGVDITSVRSIALCWRIDFVAWIHLGEKIDQCRKEHSECKGKVEKALPKFQSD